MRIILIGRERSDYGREIRDYIRDFAHQTGGEIELVDPDSRDGISFCQSYGIRRYPTIIAISDDSQMQQMWSGKPLPLISELSYYNH